MNGGEEGVKVKRWNARKNEERLLYENEDI
jgi:hypothetical protein